MYQAFHYGSLNFIAVPQVMAQVAKSRFNKDSNPGPLAYQITVKVLWPGTELMSWDILTDSHTHWHLNKVPMGHIAHLRKQFKSINTYDYITLILRRKNIINLMRIYWFFNCTNLNLLHPRMLCGSGEEDLLISSMYFHYFVIISPLHLNKF